MCCSSVRRAHVHSCSHENALQPGAEALRRVTSIPRPRPEVPSANMEPARRLLQPESESASW